MEGLDRSSGNYSYARSQLQNEISDANGRIRYYEKQLIPIGEEIEKLEGTIEDQFQVYFADLEALRNSNNLAIKDIERERDEELNLAGKQKTRGTAIYNTNSLPDLIVALQQATDDNHIMSRISLFIMMLFIMLETAPVFG